MGPEEARKLLRGSGKGERLTERLLKYRANDIIKTTKKFEEEISSDYYIKRFPTSRKIGHVRKQD